MGTKAVAMSDSEDPILKKMREIGMKHPVLYRDQLRCAYGSEASRPDREHMHIDENRDEPLKKGLITKLLTLVSR
jgi:hypothetical protein